MLCYISSTNKFVEVKQRDNSSHIIRLFRASARRANTPPLSLCNPNLPQQRLYWLARHCLPKLYSAKFRGMARPIQEDVDQSKPSSKRYSFSKKEKKKERERVANDIGAVSA